MAFGDLHVRGPWVVSGYYEAKKSPLVDGWFPTGDVATIDPDGYLRITDRSKDVVKSGGEWISSIALENLAMAHPAVQEAAVIACTHPKWDERPLLIVVRRPGQQVTRERAPRVLRRQGREMVDSRRCGVRRASLPHTATGKLMKTALRDQFRNHSLPAATAGGETAVA